MLASRAALLTTLMACSPLSGLDDYHIGDAPPSQGGTAVPTGAGGAGGVGGDGTAGGGQSGIHTLELPIAANEHDARDDGGSMASIDETAFGDTTYRDHAGLQWSLPIPQGATIVTARVSVYGAGRVNDTDAYTAVVAVEDTVSPQPFDGTVDDIINRAYWPSTVDWPMPEYGLPIGAWSDSPSIVSLVDRMVGHSAWQSGDMLSLVIRGKDDAGGCLDYIEDYSMDATLSARLHVTFTLP